MPAVEVYRALWRHKYLIVGLTLLAAAAAFVYSSSQAKVYEATALVRIQQRAAAPDETFGSLGSLDVGERLAQTYATIVSTRSIEERVAERLRAPRRDVDLKASPVGGVDLLEITASSHIPAVAASVANATTAVLKEFIKETGTLRDQIVVIDPAVPPDQPVSPRPKLAVAVAVLLALLLNGVLALAIEFFSDRLPSLDEFEGRFGYPLLATIPNLPVQAPRPSHGDPPVREAMSEPLPTGGADGAASQGAAWTSRKRGATLGQ